MEPMSTAMIYQAAHDAARRCKVASYSLKEPIEAVIRDGMVEIELPDGGNIRIAHLAFHQLFERQPRESAFQRAKRLQSEAIRAAQEALNESVEAGKKFKELFESYFKPEE